MFFLLHVLFDVWKSTSDTVEISLFLRFSRTQFICGAESIKLHPLSSLIFVAYRKIFPALLYVYRECRKRLIWSYNHVGD